MYKNTSHVTRLVYKRIDHIVDSEKLFLSLFSNSKNSFWLDSSAVIEGYSRFSFMADDSGPLARNICYQLQNSELTIRDSQVEVSHQKSIFDYLKSELEVQKVTSDLPFDFCGGFVGYLGYEMKAECGSVAHHRSEFPDAMFIFADRFVAFDHKTEQMWAVSLVKDSDQELSANQWIESVIDTVHSLEDVIDQEPVEEVKTSATQKVVSTQYMSDRQEYLDQIDQCKAFILDGESYEICLTNQIDVDSEIDPLRVYLKLRKINPAPYSAFLKIGDIQVMSSSPERFLKIDRERMIEAKPIKGTIARSSSPEKDEALRRKLQQSEKDCAENLMIVDLLRNDIGMVAKENSVHVPKLLDIESFATVHQMVSTIRGEINSNISVVDAVRAAFPGGSMTGAPKLRTLEIIDRLEKRARGIYSGSIGYFSLNGSVDLNIVIRTLVHANSKISLGVGGAITWLSDPESEWDEIQLKARAPLASLSQ